MWNTRRAGRICRLSPVSVRSVSGDVEYAAAQINDDAQAFQFAALAAMWNTVAEVSATNLFTFQFAALAAMWNTELKNALKGFEFQFAALAAMWNTEIL